MKGIDAPKSLDGLGKELKADGIQFAVRYLCDHGFKDCLSKSEAKSLSDAGIIVAAVFENGFPTSPEYFTVERAKQDARLAIALAAKIGIPKGKPIYFAVDYDAKWKHVSDYLEALHDIVRTAGWLVGVYGSGEVCRRFVSYGYGSFTWVAGSTGWAGYAGYSHNCNILQIALDKAWLDSKGHGHDVDYNVSLTDSFGGWLL